MEKEKAHRGRKTRLQRSISTENRWHRRTPVRIDVVIFHNGLPVARGTAENVSPNGIFIQPARESLPVDTTVELEFKLPDETGDNRYRVEAEVVYHAKGGTGLMFHPGTPGYTDRFRQFMRDLSFRQPAP